MGIVFLALDTELNRNVALKIVRPDHVGTTVADEATPLELKAPKVDSPASEAFRVLSVRFLQEAWVTGALEHPGIVPVYEVGQTPGGVPFYTMRFVRGERTLESAMRAAATFEDRIALLEPFLKVCDTMSYAHSRGVIHRDLKPANIALGEFGEVVLLDWGLAKLRDRPDQTLSRWREQLKAFREAADLETAVSALGTPGYMPPESLLGRPGDVDEKSDVYSLGAVLYRILAGRLPYEFDTFPEFVAKISAGEPVPPREIDPSVPEALSRLCLHALAKERAERIDSARELAEAIRAWQRESTREREIEMILREALSAWEGTEGLTGEALLRQLDRVLGRANRVLELRADHSDARALRARAEAARSRAAAERERMAKRRLLRRMFDQKRRAILRLADAKTARDLIRDSETLWPIHPDRAGAMASWLSRVEEVLGRRAWHESRLTEIGADALPYCEEERLRDHSESHRKLEELRRDRELYQVKRKAFEAMNPDEATAYIIDLLNGCDIRLVPTKEQWLRQVDRRQAEINAEIAALEATVARRGTWRFKGSAEAWQHQILTDLLADLAVLADGEDSLVKRVEARRELAVELAPRSVEDHRAAWEETISAIADQERHPAYRGLRIRPQLGLVPLGLDPESGLFEFAHLGSGRIPGRDARTGGLELAEDTGIVLILLPGGPFDMGAQKEDPAAPNYDPAARDDEDPVRRIDMHPILLSKYEVTQGQWARMTEGERPSLIGPGSLSGNREVDDRHPVESVSWLDARDRLARHRLRLPSEAEWEYACRAGTDTPWSTGREPSSLFGTANVGDKCLADSSQTWRDSLGKWKIEVTFDDGHVYHAPVGSFAPNAFGLHDAHGNLLEFCEDWYHEYDDPDTPSDGSARTQRGGANAVVCRGGSWAVSPAFCRSARREGSVLDFGGHDKGVRPAADLE